MRKILILAAPLAFAAGSATAAVIINLNRLDRVSVCMEEIAPCVPGADCSLVLTVTGTATGDSGYSQSAVLQFRSEDAE